MCDGLPRIFLLIIIFSEKLNNRRFQRAYSELLTPSESRILDFWISDQISGQIIKMCGFLVVVCPDC